MTDQDRNREREHWQAIAEQLGLSADEQPPAREPSPAVAPAATTEPPSPRPAAAEASREPEFSQQARTVPSEAHDVQPEEPPIARHQEEKSVAAEPEEKTAE